MLLPQVSCQVSTGWDLRSLFSSTSPQLFEALLSQLGLWKPLHKRPVWIHILSLFFKTLQIALYHVVPDEVLTVADLAALAMGGANLTTAFEGHDIGVSAFGWFAGWECAGLSGARCVVGEFACRQHSHTRNCVNEAAR